MADSLLGNNIGGNVNMRESFSRLSTSDSGEENSIIIHSSNVNEDKIADESYLMEPVRDRFKVVYIIVYILGIGSLLPWNFFINAKPYFLYKLRDVNSTNYLNPANQTNLQVHFESYLTAMAAVTNVAFMFLNAAFTKIIALKIRMYMSLGAMISMFSVTLVLIWIDTDTWQVQFFLLTLATVFIMIAGSAVMQGGIFGMAGHYPIKYTQAVMGGISMGGTIAAIASIVSLAIDVSPVTGAFVFFSIATAVLLLSLLGYIALSFVPFAKYRNSIKGDRIFKPLIVNEGDERIEHDVAIVPERSRGVSMFVVFKRIWRDAFGIYIIFAVTLSCFPVINSAIYSVDYYKGDAWHEKFFIPVICFLLFNVGDLLGRTIAGFVKFPSESSVLLPVFCVLRVLFIPIFLLCNVQPRFHLPLVFDNDWVPICAIIVFALSNGYLGTLCMMYGPIRAKEEGEVAGAMMSFFLALGLTTGSLFSLLLIRII